MLGQVQVSGSVLIPIIQHSYAFSGLHNIIHSLACLENVHSLHRVDKRQENLGDHKFSERRLKYFGCGKM